ncbi:MAG TPA: disulfide reductase [Thermoflexia bacterium]|nr:disulfide reductase [Thermoflexia bacterium]
MRYAYYPGCSLERNAAAYDESFRLVAEVLGMELVEIPDWNCCGATEYFSLDLLPAYALVARNLALVPEDLDQVVAPCSACYYNLLKTDKNMAAYPKLASAVNESLAAGKLHYTPGRVRSRHALDVILEDFSLEDLAAHVEKPLRGIRLAAYYGCVTVRPMGHDDPEYPIRMERLLKALGATVVEFSLRANCCGGHMTQLDAETAYEMLHYLLRNAAKLDVDALVTACPMCQLNLDAYQGQVNSHFGTDFHIPILYFTQVMGLAFGIDPDALGFGQEIVSAERVLEKFRNPPEEEEKKPRRKRRDKDALPMPEPLSGGGR